MSQREVVIVSAVRTAIGDFGGSLKDIPPTELAARAITGALDKAGVAAADVEHTVLGNVVHSDRRDMYISRVAALHAGIPESSPSLTVNRLCGSGLQAIVSAAQLILLGDADVVVAGGAESMSRIPYWLPAARFGQRMGDGVMTDPMVGVLTCPMGDVHMGVTAENIAEKWGVSRADQDALAVESHNRAERAISEKRFADQIIPVEIKGRKGTVVFEQDEHVRFGANIDDMTKLRAAFKADGSVTAGNSSGLNDAAAALVMMEKSVAEQKGLVPMAKMLGYTTVGVDPKYMGIGPVPAVKKLLAKAGLNIADIDVWEVNEAFAAQALAVCRDLGLPSEKVNPNGSGISLGHPIGASGAIIAVKALHELKRIGGRYAVATLCIGGGQGIAALFERI